MEDVYGYKKGFPYCDGFSLLPLVTSWISVVSPGGFHVSSSNISHIMFCGSVPVICAIGFPAGGGGEGYHLWL